MRTSRILRTLVALPLVALVAAGLAFAGGPLYTYDYENRITYAWHMETWPGAAVPYYTDLGPLGRLGNTRAGELVNSAFSEWNNVPSSSYLAGHAGSFAVLGLPDIVCPNVATCNANLVVGTWNGGGVHVIYDTDGKILNNFLGIYGALGVSSIEFVSADSNEMLEAWTILNGPSVQSSDPLGDRFRGVMTHEFGHTTNLAHSQANGAVYQYADAAGPMGCTLPYAGAPVNDQIETMYPYINLGTTGTGLGMATVDRMDDIAAFSDLYPAAGWPESHGTIRGTVSSMLNIRGNGSGDTAQVTGVNVIARNLASPFGDFTSYVSGQVTKGQVGADGTFEIHGLTPGAQYVVYVDNLRNGAFSVPRLLVLPGPEEFYNGAGENGNGMSDDRCASVAITAQAGGAADASIVFNRVKGAPEFIPQPTTGTPTDITSDGSIVVGTTGSNPMVAYVWNLADNTVTGIGGYANGGQAAISDDGTKIAFSAKNASNVIAPAVYENGAWTILPLRPDAVTPCSGGWGSAYDISGDGSTVVGLSYANGCSQSNGTIRGFWSRNGATIALPKSPDALPRAGRANTVNYDGTVVGGWDDASNGYRRGAYWNVGLDGVAGPANIVQTDPTNPSGEALEVSADGTTILGYNGRMNASDFDTLAWHITPPGSLEFFPNLEGGHQASAIAVSDDKRVVGGYSGVGDWIPYTRVPTIWTEELGWTNLNLFLNAQGTYAQDITIANPMAMSGNGQVITGWAGSIFGSVGWVVKMPKVVICHANPGNPAITHTIDVSFPGGMADHLAHGDTIGMCQTGGE